METTIVLKQLPVIIHKLEQVGEEVKVRIKELNIDSLVATEDTVKSLKELRAELNKELKAFEDQRKTVKDGISKPYLDFEAVYKTQISENYKASIETLKGKIDKVETQVKDEKTESLVAYFDEVCLSHDIDFLEFKNTGVAVNLSTTLKKYKEQVAEFVQKVGDDLLMIETTEHGAEILVEYKKDFNISRSIMDVNVRKENEKKEADVLKRKKAQDRIARVTSLGMSFDDVTQEYDFSNKYFISLGNIDNMADGEFEVIFSQLEENIKKETTSNAAPVQKPTTSPAPEKAAAKTADVETFKAIFEVTGTREQLQALGKYMKVSNLTYKNLK